ncbi:uncharacterized protein LOC129743722 [Uranotaenia lowii]|uniref:uncharacterized protein LOC129743722 n=1 Tax=Uranotaenia lowii TaxID=190385 RepID=UPI002479F691|nr:uncharacterized protein LOC129743722 [Uranotaenia lowii]
MFDPRVRKYPGMDRAEPVSVISLRSLCLHAAASQQTAPVKFWFQSFGGVKAKMEYQSNARTNSRAIVLVHMMTGNTESSQGSMRDDNLTINKRVKSRSIATEDERPVDPKVWFCLFHQFWKSPPSPTGYYGYCEPL